MGCGGGAGELPVEVVIAYAYTKVLVTRHGRFAVGCPRLRKADTVGCIVLCLEDGLMKRSLSAWDGQLLDKLKHGHVGVRPATCDLHEVRERRVSSPHKRRFASARR